MSDVANTLRSAGHDASEDGPGRQPAFVASVAENQRGELREADVSPSFSTGGGQGYPAVRSGSAIRRLTPTERERLMGAPDGWTYPDGPSLADARNNYPDESVCVIDMLPDGRREAAAGDGVAVPCAQWIGERIVSFECQENNQ